MATKTEDRIACEHCGTLFLPKGDDIFCCQGCAYVSQLLHDGGFDRFYELKGEKAVPPVGSRVFQDADTTWLVETVKHAEASSKTEIIKASFGVQGISCVGCVWLIEAIFNNHPGSVSIHIDPRCGGIRLTWLKNGFNAVTFSNELQKLGYRLQPKEEKNEAEGASKRLSHRIGLCGFFLLNTMLFTLPGYLGMAGDFFLAPLFQILGAFFATLSMIAGGSYFFARAWTALRHKVLHIDFPIALGLGAAYVGSLIGWLTGHTSLIYFDFVATFVFLMLLGRWLQEYAIEKNRSHLDRRNPGPRQVTLLGGSDDGREISAESICEAQSYSVSPGEINPVSARLLDHEASLSLEWINGEAEPVTSKKGKIVPAGAINVGLNSTALKAEESWNESLLAKLLQRPADNFSNQRLQKILGTYIAVVLTLATIGGAAWWLLADKPIVAIQVFVSVLIVSCPCALGVALPMADEFCNSALRRAGLFIKSNDIWERLRHVSTIVFDKTGTLTLEIPRLTNPKIIESLPVDSINALYKLVQRNLHPLARSLRETILSRIPSRCLQDEETRFPIHEQIGQGVYFTDEAGNQWTLGKPEWMAKEANTRPCDTKNPTTVLRQNGIHIAQFFFNEDVRDDAVDAIDAFKENNFDVTILSGDATEHVSRVASALNIDSAHTRSRCTPNDKAEWIHRNAPDAALMIGDGANDSLAFDTAICRGTPVIDRSILEASSDFFFFGRSLRCLPLLFNVAKARRRTVALIFALAVAYNIGAVSLCLAGAMHPLLAAILMPLSSIVTLLVAWLGLGK
ncbi:HAD-IC family P-type ATPase [Rubellicoccus peritrichatus]|uniref:HAD-IC family P-type ATPase n=1 Tax=Rubellicoccus peritrichatus TaxID=3080537 RepID=A0AAQ3QU90_9BACT|nr:HAD-IC family P-type ATPase [Puniceicoccus sp. CR14]WOO40218.1 HAD-IC family P-type ATPase [Puniceicoccus sp. CR14]